MNIIIFSKDRAMQLDALFQTIARYLPFTYNIAVVFKASNASFAAGYARLMSRAGPIAWLHESNFRSQVLSCLSSDNEYTMLECDDSMFFGPAWFTGLADHVLCHSLRLGRNTTLCYPTSQSQRIPQDFPVWRYRDAEADFAYPFSTTGHIYRTKDLFDIMDARGWSSPNTLEASMVGAQSWRPFMTAPVRSCSVCIPHNKVQNDFPNREEGGNPDKLNDLFLAGRRIRPFAMDFSQVPAAHWPVPFVFTEK